MTNDSVVWYKSQDIIIYAGKVYVFAEGSERITTNDEDDPQYPYAESDYGYDRTVTRKFYAAKFNKNTQSIEFDKNTIISSTQLFCNDDLDEPSWHWAPEWHIDDTDCAITIEDTELAPQNILDFYGLPY
jgi:hypothetical protein